MTVTNLSIVPMPAERVPAYFRSFAEWYAEALGDLACTNLDGLHEQVLAYLQPYLGADGLPAGSMVFDIFDDNLSAPVGATWCGGADFGFGPVFYVHDLRIFAPFRRKGYAKEALATIHDLSRARGGLRGVGLSVLVQNTLARRLYLGDGFVPLSEVLVKPFGTGPVHPAVEGAGA
jgi:ribosomal protein S18 acetylase RimI-like enzyme